MKWPLSITCVRHAQSAFNRLRAQKDEDPEYQEFIRAYDEHPYSRGTQRLALRMRDRFALGVSDYDTPLTDDGDQQAMETGDRLRAAWNGTVPHVVYVSPYLRTQQTLTRMEMKWPELRGVRHVVEDRIREQEHGLSLLYSDWRIFQTLHPEQRRLRELLGPYWYQYPQGESVSQVRDRIRSFVNPLVRKHASQHVLLITHHLTILSIRSILERLSSEEFIRLNEEERPKNCSVTAYEGDPSQGREGRLVLRSYNTCYWSSSSQPA